MKVNAKLFKDFLTALDEVVDGDAVIRFDEHGMYCVWTDSKKTRLIYTDLTRYALREYGYTERSVVVNVPLLCSVLGHACGVMEVYVKDGKLYIQLDGEEYKHHVVKPRYPLEPMMPRPSSVIDDRRLVVEVRGAALMRLVRRAYPWQYVRIGVRDACLYVTADDGEDYARIRVADDDVLNRDKLNGLDASSMIPANYLSARIFEPTDTVKLVIAKDAPVTFIVERPNGLTIVYMIASLREKMG